jgi:hypothetical protein
MAKRADVDKLMDQLHFAAVPSPKATWLLTQIEARAGRPLAPALALFLSRSIGKRRELELEWSARWNKLASALHLLMTFDDRLVMEWSWQGDPLVDELVVIADDVGDFIFAIDPAGVLGHNTEAVYSIAKGARSLDSVELVAPTIAELLECFVEQRQPRVPIRRVVELRDKATKRRALGLRLGDGSELSPADVTEPRYFPARRIVRSVQLRRAATICGVALVPASSSASSSSDVELWPDGTLKSGYAAGAIGELEVEPGSFVAWDRWGKLGHFTLAQTTRIVGVPCRGGTQVSRDRASHYFVFTPDVDVDYRGLPCKAGEQVSSGRDYVSFTAARAFALRSHPAVSAGARVFAKLDATGAVIRLR